MDSVINHFVLLNPPNIIEGIVFLLLLILVLYGSYRSTRHLDSTKKRTVIVSLHLLSFLLIIFILFNPAYRTANYKEDKKKLAIIVDSSWSINLPGGSEGNTRNESIKSYLVQHNKFLSQIEKDFYVEYYLFDQGLRTTSLNSILKNEPNGSITDIGKVLEGITKKNKNNELDTAIIISDGADNKEALDSLSEKLAGVDFPINTISPVTEENIYDIWIDDIEASEVTFLRYPFTIDVSIKSSIGDSFEIPVSLYEEDKLIAIKEASLDKDSKEAKVAFEVNPLSLGRKI